MKKLLVAAFGGGCCICAYDRCVEALDFHHLDPSIKDLGLSSWATAASFDKLSREAAKCVLLCVRCHRELHAGITTLPAEPRRFCEALYNTAKEAAVLDRKSEIKARKEAAKAVQRKHARKAVDWTGVDVIAMRKAGVPLVAIATAVGVTKHAVQKRLKKLGSII